MAGDSNSSRQQSGSSAAGEQDKGPFLFPRLSGETMAWFALYVQVNHEKKVTERLQQKSIDVFLPLMTCWSRRKDRRKRIELPLFPGYIFLNTILDNYTNLTILKTPGVITLLRSSEGPIPIPNYQIENLQTLLGAAAPLSPHDYLKDGDWVQVVNGPFSGCMGILLRQNPKKGRLVVSVDLIQKSISVEMNVEEVKTISRPQPADRMVRPYPP